MKLRNYLATEFIKADDGHVMSQNDVETSIAFEKQYIDQFFKHDYINKLQKINKIVKEGDIVDALDCYGLKVIVGIEKCHPVAKRKYISFML